MHSFLCGGGGGGGGGGGTNLGNHSSCGRLILGATLQFLFLSVSRGNPVIWKKSAAVSGSFS